MSTLAEIEEAIDALPAEELDALAVWLEKRRQTRDLALPVDQWLQQARGAAIKGITTDGILAMTRGEE